MKIKIILFVFILLTLAFQTSPYARRIRPVASTPVSCQENEIMYNMTSHSLFICTNAGYVALATGASGSFAPSNATYITQTANGTLTNEQALASLATGILKNTTTTGILSIAGAADFAELIAVTDLTTYNGLSGTGTTAVGATFTSLTSNDVLTWSGTNWINQAASGGGSVGSGNVNMTLPNNAATGTTTNKLVKITGAPSTAIISATADTDQVVGVCTSGCGTTGNATVAILGQVQCVFDGSTTAGNFVVNSDATAGNCEDAGSTFPTSRAAIGRVLSTNGGAGTYSMELMTPDIAFQNAGNGKSRPGGSNESIQFNSSNTFGGTSFIVSNGTHFALSQNQGSIIGFSNSGATGISFGGLAASGVGTIKIVADNTASPGTILSNFTLLDTSLGGPAPFSSKGMNFERVLAGDISIGNPANHGGDGTAPSGYRFSILLIQDGTGGRTASWGSDYRFLNGITPTLSRTANATDRFDFVVRSDIAYEISRSIQDSSDVSVASDLTNATTTFSNITGLSANIRNTGKYSFKMILYASDDVAADGAKFDFDGGTATFSNTRIHCTGFDAALVLSSQVSAIATDFTIATLTGDSLFECYGTLEASASGTFIPRFAQNAHTTGTLTLYKGSHLLVTPMP